MKSPIFNAIEERSRALGRETESTIDGELKATDLIGRNTTLIIDFHGGNFLLFSHCFLLFPHCRAYARGFLDSSFCFGVKKILNFNYLIVIVSIYTPGFTFSFDSTNSCEIKLRIQINKVLRSVVKRLIWRREHPSKMKDLGKPKL